MLKRFHSNTDVKTSASCDLCAANVWMKFRVSEGTFINIVGVRLTGVCLVFLCVCVCFFHFGVKEMRNNCT